MPYRIGRDGEPLGKERLSLLSVLAEVRDDAKQAGPFHRIRRQGQEWGALTRLTLHLLSLQRALRRSAVSEVTRVAHGSERARGETLYAIKRVPDVEAPQPPGTVETPYGYIYPTVGSCRDDYPNIETFISKAGQQVTLQAPAAAAFRAAEELAGPIPVTGSWRSCEIQAGLYAKDPKRYADPDVTRHCRGLAVDVDTGHLNSTVLGALETTGWNRSRPSEEPWHHSFSETG